MNSYAMRRRLQDDGFDADEIAERLAEEAERRNDDARDRQAEEDLYKETP